MNSPTYFYSPGPENDPVGPVTVEELHALAAQRVIAPDTPVIAEGARSWGRYRDFLRGERTREIAESVAAGASHLAAALRREESRNFGLGFLMGVIQFFLLPWRLVLGSARAVAEWGASRDATMPGESLASSTLGGIVIPVGILLWTAWWFFDAVALLLFGQPVVTFTLAGWAMAILTAGTPAAEMMRFGGALGGSLSLDLEYRLPWAFKTVLVGYFLTVAWALVGEGLRALASIVHGRGSARPGPGF